VAKRQACSEEAPHQAPVHLDSIEDRTTDQRHEVSETSDGLGQSSRASDRSGRSWCEAIVIDTSPWPDESRLAVVLARRSGKPRRREPSHS
jgi:hypothetical protein